MKRQTTILILIALVLVSAGVIHAQTATPDAIENLQAQVDDLPETVTVSRELLTELLVIVERAEMAEARATAAQDAAFSLFGLLEPIALLIAGGGVILGIFGWYRISRAENGLDAARNRAEELARKLQDVAERIEREHQQQSAELAAIPLTLTTKFESAFQRTQQAIGLIPLAQQQFKAGNLDGALDIYERAAELDRENPVTLYHIGYIYTQQNRIDEAIEVLIRALDISPDLQQVRAALGFAYRRKGQTMPTTEERDRYYEMARKELEVALANVPGLVDDDGESWWGSLGGLYKRWGREGDLEKAINAYQRAADYTPKSSYPFINLGLLHLTHKPTQPDYKQLLSQARDLALKEIQARIDNHWAYGDLMMIYLVVDRDEDAARDTLRDLISVYPKDAQDVMSNIRATLIHVAQTHHPHDPEFACMILNFVSQIRGEGETVIIPDDARHILESCS